MRNILLPLLLLAALAGCSAAMSNNAEFAIDTSALAALSSEKAVLQRPCTAERTTLCVDHALAEKLGASRKLVMSALQTYWAARDAYKKDATDGNKSATEAAYAALQAALDSANSLLSLTEIDAIIQTLKQGSAT